MNVAAVGLLAAALLIALFGAWSLVEARRIRRDADRNLERELARAAGERAALIDRVMHLAGNTWTLPPSLLSETRDEREPKPAAVYRADVENFLSGFDFEHGEAELVPSNGSGAVL